jgi:hypothetical protein
VAGALGVKAASRCAPSGSSSSPVCIEPINTRFLSVVNPRSSGAKTTGSGS